MATIAVRLLCGSQLRRWLGLLALPLSLVSVGVLSFLVSRLMPPRAASPVEEVRSEAFLVDLDGIDGFRLEPRLELPYDGSKRSVRLVHSPVYHGALVQEQVEALIAAGRGEALETRLAEPYGDRVRSAIRDLESSLWEVEQGLRDEEARALAAIEGRDGVFWRIRHDAPDRAEQHAKMTQAVNALFSRRLGTLAGRGGHHALPRTRDGDLSASERERERAQTMKLACHALLVIVAAAGCSGDRGETTSDPIERAPVVRLDLGRQPPRASARLRTPLAPLGSEACFHRLHASCGCLDVELRAGGAEVKPGERVAAGTELAVDIGYMPTGGEGVAHETVTIYFACLQPSPPRSD